MKLCALLLSLGSLIGTTEIVLDVDAAGDLKPQVAFSEKATLSIPSTSSPDFQRRVEDALSDTQNRDLALSDLLHTGEGE